MARNNNYILLVIDNKERYFENLGAALSYIFDHPNLQCFDIDMFLCSKQYLGTLQDPDKCEACHAE